MLYSLWMSICYKNILNGGLRKQNYFEWSSKLHLPDLHFCFNESSRMHKMSTSCLQAMCREIRKQMPILQTQPVVKCTQILYWITLRFINTLQEKSVYFLRKIKRHVDSWKIWLYVYDIKLLKLRMWSWGFKKDL